MERLLEMRDFISSKLEENDMVSSYCMHKSDRGELVDGGKDCIVNCLLAFNLLYNGTLKLTMKDVLLSGFHTEFFSGGGTLFDHTHFCWNHTHLIKICLRSRIRDINLGRLMRIAIEGPQLIEVN